MSRSFSEKGTSQGQSEYLNCVLRPKPQAPSHSIDDAQRDKTSDWINLRLQPVLSQHGSTRLLMRPKIEGVRIGPFHTSQPFGHWAKVEMDGDEKPAAVLVVEPDHIHIGCIVSYNDTQFHLFFDPGHDHLYFSNHSPRPLFTNQLDGEHWVLPGETATLDVGSWSINTDDKSLIEIQVLKRKAWVTTQVLPANCGTATDEDLSKEIRLLNDGGAAQNREIILARNPDANNALIELNKGEKIYVGESKVYWLKRLDTIHDDQNSSVWLAEHRKWDDGRKIVAKVIKPEGYNNEVIDAAKAWRKECEAHVAVTKSPHHAIVNILGFDARFHSIYTEYIDAPLLAHYCRPDSSFQGNRVDARQIMQDIASALRQVHYEKHVHNDIKPGNILYSRERGAVLINFGLSFVHGHPSPVGGTPWYLPPEFMMNWELCGPASDIWALGVVMLWVLGYIPLPDMRTDPWDASQIHSTPGSAEHQHAINSMSEWIEYIDEARLRLRKDNELEAIVNKTLEFKFKDRIDAESLCRELGSLKPTAP